MGTEVCFVHARASLYAYNSNIIIYVFFILPCTKMIASEHCYLDNTECLRNTYSEDKGSIVERKVKKNCNNLHFDSLSGGFRKC